MINRGARIGFTLFLLTFTSILFFLTLRLGRIAHLVPLWVVIPTLVLLVVQLLLDIVPKLIKKHGKSRDIRFSVYEGLKGRTRNNIVASSPGTSRDIYKELRIHMWILGMIISIYLFGLLYAVPLYAFLYLKWRAGEGWLPSIAMATTMWCLLYGFFIFMLRKTLYQGQLWVWLGF